MDAWSVLDEEPETAPGESVAILQFRSLYEAHRAVGDVESLERYQARFPGHETAIETEYRRLCAEQVLVHAPSSMEEVAVRLARQEGERYLTLDSVGRGGMGMVMRIRDRHLGRDLAMKVIVGSEGRLRNPDDKDGEATVPAPGPMLRRFLLEAQITAQLDHPGVVPVHELSVDEEGYAYFTMKLVRGISLADAIRHVRVGHDGWTFSRAMQMLIRVCETVAFAHTRGVIHRDLKPANIMVGEYGQVYVVDWGLAKVLRKDATAASGDVSDEAGPASETPTPREESPSSSSSETVAGTVLGTPQYMPPEQAAGRVDSLDERTDVYSLGAILYELLSGVAPYAVPGQVRSAHEVVREVLLGPPRPLSEIAREVPEELQAITARAMARDPEQRYSTALDLADDLHRFLDGRVVRAHRRGPLVELRKWVARNRAVAGLLVATAVMAMGGVAAFAVRERDSALVLLGERNTAFAARDAARMASSRADGQRLAARSLLIVNDLPSTALSLAIEAGTMAPGLDSNTALYMALERVRERRRFSGNDQYVEGAHFSPDGRSLLTNDMVAYLCVWDVDSAELRWAVDDHRGRILRCAYSPDGGRVASCSMDGTVRIYDSADGRAQAVIEAGEGPIADIAFDSTGERIATASTDGTARIFDAEDGRERVRFEGHGAPVISVEISPDGAVAATTGEDMRVRVWSTADGVERFASPLGENLDPVPVVFVEKGELPNRSSARFVDEGRSLLCDSAREDVRLLDAADGRLIRILAGGARPGRLLAASRDASHVVVLERGAPGPGGGRDTAVILDGKGSRAEVRVDPSFRVTWASLSPDGTRLLAGNGGETPVLVDTSTGAIVERYLGHLYGVGVGEFSPDGNLVVTGSRDATARTWDVHNPGWMDVRIAAGSGVATTVVAVDRDGKKAIRIHPSEEGRRGAVELVALGTNEVIARLEDAGFEVISAAFDGVDRLVGLGGKGCFRTWDPGSGGLSPTVQGEMQPIGSFSSDGARVVLREKERVTVHDVATLQPWPGGAREVPGLVRTSWSPDGSRLIASNGPMASWSLFDASTGETLVRYPRDKGWAMHAAFSHDGRRVATTSVTRTVHLRRPEDGAVVATWSGLAMEGHLLDFYPDGTRLIVCGRRRLRILEVPSLQPQMEFDSPADVRFDRAWFSADGQSVVVLHLDGTVRLLPVEPLAFARKRVHGPTSGGLRKQFSIGPPEEIHRIARADALRTGEVRALFPLAQQAIREGDEEWAVRAIDRMLGKRPRLPEGHVARALLECRRAGQQPEGTPGRSALQASAMESLTAALDRGWLTVSGLAIEPEFSVLAGDSRFADLCKRELELRDSR